MTERWTCNGLARGRGAVGPIVEEGTSTAAVPVHWLHHPWVGALPVMQRVQDVEGYVLCKCHANGGSLRLASVNR